MNNVDESKYNRSLQISELLVLKKERASMSVSPKSIPLADYSTPGTTMELALREFNEAMPNGQKARTEKAFRILNAQIEEIGVILRHHGYDV